MKYLNRALMGCLILAAASCQNKDIDIQPAKVAPIDPATLTGQLVENDYVINWQAKGDGLTTIVSTYSNGTMVGSTNVSGTTYTHKDIETNIEYTYIIRLTDGTNQSNGAIHVYTRPGASKMSGLTLAQVESNGKYDMLISWDANSTATKINMNATNGSRQVKESLQGSATSYTVPDVKVNEEWKVELIAENNEGRSLPISAGLRIGKTAVGFLSSYATVDELKANGDDDEICAWLWLNEAYPSAQYLYFGDINSDEQLDNFRVLFWMRDLEGVDAGAVFDYPVCVESATPYITSWYKNGGNLLLWSHATAYIGKLGRIDTDLLKAANAIGTGAGGFNGDTWKMAVSLNPGGKFTRDHSTHAIFRGLTIESNDRCKLIAFKGPGWTEDHNCLYFDIPTALTGLGNQDEDCYTKCVNEYGIIPLGTWDSQIEWISQLNVWEAQQGNTEYKGTALCIGNGGCEFSLKNEDGTPDLSAHPKNNIYQDNVLRLAKNAIEYLKTR